MEKPGIGIGKIEEPEELETEESEVSLDDVIGDIRGAMVDTKLLKSRVGVLDVPMAMDKDKSRILDHLDEIEDELDDAEGEIDAVREGKMTLFRNFRELRGEDEITRERELKLRKKAKKIL